MGHPHHELHHVLDEEDGDPLLLVQPPQPFVELAHLLQVHARGRLVQQQQPGAGGEGPRELEAPLLPEREAARELVALVGEPGELELLLDRRPPAPAPGEPAREEALRPHRLLPVLGHPQVLPHREVREEADVLEGPGDAGPQGDVGRAVGDLRPLEPDAPRGGREHPADEVDGGALAGAVGADEPEDLPLLHGHVEAVHRPHPAEVLGEGAQLKHRRAPLPPGTASPGCARRGRR